MELFNLFNKSSKHNIERQIDDKNKHLWDEISGQYDIEVISWKRGEYAAEVQGNRVTLFVSDINVNPALFTHELLHLKLRLNNVLFAIFIYKVCENQLALANIFNLQNALLIGNLLDHVFMYNEYIEMGYTEENFAFDYGTDKFTEDEEKMLSEGFSNRIIKSDIAGYYITKYVALRTLKESGKDYTHAFNALSAIDSQLYQISKKMMDELMVLSLNGYKSVSEQYIQIIGDFLIGLELWTEDKVII